MAVFHRRLVSEKKVTEDHVSILCQRFAVNFAAASSAK
jgi:hypothetical protein